jgi:hypothetical protein
MKTLHEKMSENARVYANARDTKLSVRACFLRNIARAVGIAGGAHALVKPADITEEVLQRVADEYASDVSELGADKLTKDWFDDTRRDWQRAFKHLGVAVKVELSYRLEGSKGTKPLAFTPQWTHGGSETTAPWTIGARFTAASGKPENALPDPENDKVDRAAEYEAKTLEARQAKAAQAEAERKENERLADAVRTANEQARADARLLIGDDAARETVLAVLDDLPAIVASNLSEASDAVLIAELKARGYRVSKIKATA